MKKTKGLMALLLVVVLGGLMPGMSFALPYREPGVVTLERTVRYAYQGDVAYYYDFRTGAYGLMEKRDYLEEDIILIPAKNIRKVEPFNENGLARVTVIEKCDGDIIDLSDDELGGKGVINHQGRWVIPPYYREIFLPEEEGAPILVKNEKGAFYYYSHFERQPAAEGGIEYFCPRSRDVNPLRTLWEEKLATEEGYTRIEEKELSVIMNSEGKVVASFKPEETYGKTWADGRAFVGGYAWVKEKERWGIINREGELVVPYEYEDGFYMVGGLGFGEKNGLLGGINMEGKIVIPFQYRAMYDMGDGLIQVQLWSSENKEFIRKCGLKNTKGEEILPVEYDLISYPSEGLIGVKKDGHWGAVDFEGNLVMDYQFQLPASGSSGVFDFAFHQGLACVQVEGGYGYVNLSGELVLPGPWPNARPFGDEVPLAPVLINREAEPEFYQKLKLSSAELEEYKERYLWGYINTQGEIAFPYAWPRVHGFQGKVALVEQTFPGSYQFIDSYGTEAFDLGIGFFNKAVFENGYAVIDWISASRPGENEWNDYEICINEEGLAVY